MLVLPPRPNVLEPEDPRLAVCAIGNRCPQLIVTVGFVRIEPVITFAPKDIALEIFEVMDRICTLKAIDMRFTITPVGKRPVIVDGDGIHIRRHPERVEIEKDIA